MFLETVTMVERANPQIRITITYSCSTFAMNYPAKKYIYITSITGVQVTFALLNVLLCKRNPSTWIFLQASCVASITIQAYLVSWYVKKPELLFSSTVSS
jgi:hypothetical protein